MTIMKKNLFAGLISAVLGLLFISAAHAQVLLTINDTIPGATIITATGTFPTTTVTGDSADSFNDGIDLLELFTNSLPANTPFTVGPSSLTAGDTNSGPALDTAYN